MNKKKSKNAKAKPELSGDENFLSLEALMPGFGRLFDDKKTLSDRELNAFLESQMASGEIFGGDLDPLDEAQSLIYEAWNTSGPRKLELAREALDISPDCADAYILLAEAEQKNRGTALNLYLRAVEAGKKAVDPAHFPQSPEYFWEAMETRPFMRAKLGLAQCLWELHRREEAIGHLRELIRLNPADPQKAGDILAKYLAKS